MNKNSVVVKIGTNCTSSLISENCTTMITAKTIVTTIVTSFAKLSKEVL
jgi:hypothetical protein